LKKLILVGLSAFLTVPALANHWNFQCGYGDGTVNIRINNKKAKLIAPFAKGVFTFSEKSARVKVYKGKTNEGQAMLLAPTTNFQLSQVPMGAKAEFTYEVAGPNEAVVIRCETRPTLSRDPDLN
jgi:hypothetical protein